MKGPRLNVDIVLGAALAVVALVMGGLIVARSREAQTASGPSSQTPVPAQLLSLDGTALRGSPQAPVAIVEFSDFECPFCRAFVHETFPALDEQFVQTNHVLFAFHHLPLPALHPQAVDAAEAAECARTQDRFWRMHDLLFAATPAQLTDTGLLDRARRAGLDLDLFTSCRTTAAREAVQRQIQAAHALGIRGTPTFVIGRVQPDRTVKAVSVLQGAAPLADFARAIRQASEAAAASRGSDY